MATFSVHFDTDNDAFQDGNAAEEIARILDEIAKKVRAGLLPFGVAIRDINGNTVGEFAWVKQ